MLALQGKGVCGGVAIGRLAVLARRQAAAERRQITDTEGEAARFHAARQKAISQLTELYQKALGEVGEENAAIFEIHQLMLGDLDYIEAIENLIRAEKVNAEYAVQITAADFAAAFAAMDDEYMQARAADVKDVSARVLACLGDGQDGVERHSEPYILAADDLAPSETVQLDKKLVQGFVTAAGSTNSHTAILARTMGIPAVVSTGEVIGPEYDGCLIAVDGYTGEVFVDPEPQVLERMQAKLAQDAGQKKLLAQLRGQDSVTTKGQKVLLYANIGSTDDLTAVTANDAEGIGLFRSEFIYLESGDYPDEEKQLQQYKMAAEAMGGKRVIIRTLDIGADKQAAYFKLPPEENPALGYRAVRICLDKPEIFKTQLRAICRASAYGKVAVMFPMIISVDEVRRCRALLRQVQEELAAAAISFDKEMEVGIMIETPAAALISCELAREVDFFSIGTNDLSQYTLAIDRQNQRLESFFDAHHPAVLRLIEMTVQNAHAAGIWCGVCGELGADLELTEAFVAMGMDELSVSPAAILPLRQKIRSL
ncbi:phosphoenolpyruvate--protein phosphotransferase [uncultured Phascolarctobacterium sp.]|uniref:phosphoenolpyruvate--protein phosphotransferase n=1 Tax=uncultured Phascolarctobacterium sp. TaxID=512296 RepID=UPI0025EDB3B8|nr:phosphoenolpyruvate--protein phosphotransferase [uncultured Phascolarctobacterium sp.]